MMEFLAANFNLLCAPCFAAMGAIKREMNNGKWTAIAIGYMCCLLYTSPSPRDVEESRMPSSA